MLLVLEQLVQRGQTHIGAVLLYLVGGLFAVLEQLVLELRLQRGPAQMLDAPAY